MPIAPGAGDSGGGSSSSPASGGGGSVGSSGGSGGGGGGVGSPTVFRSSHNSTGQYIVTRGTVDRVEYGPPIEVDPRDSVTITALATNAVNCFYSTAGTDGAKTGPRVPLTPSGNPRTVRVRKLNEIGVYSPNPGEGVILEVLRG